MYALELYRREMKKRRSANPLVLIVECADEDSCRVHFEPLGAEHLLVSGDLLRIEVDREGADEVQVMHFPGAVSLWIDPVVHVRVTNRAGEELQL